MPQSGRRGFNPGVWNTQTSAMPMTHKKGSKDQGILHALLPGARLHKHTNKILVHTATSNQSIRFNIGGSVFETYKATLRGIPHCVLASDAFLAKHYRKEQKDYFFDRDPEIFHCILNYLRSGELHLPTSVCGPVVKSELEFWGIEESEIEECCWSRYSTWSKALQELRQLETDRKKSMMQWDLPALPSKLRGWSKFKFDAWKFFSNPSSSRAAMIYGYFTVFLIGVSIFCFCARTHTDFQVKTNIIITDIDTSVTTTPQPDHTSNSTTINSNSSSSSLTSTSYPNTGPSNFKNVSRTETRTSTHPGLLYVDVICYLFFATELMARFLVCPKKFNFLITSMTIVEISALVPDTLYYVALVCDAPSVESVFEVLQLFRVLRIFRLMRQMHGLWILAYTLKSSVKDLVLLLLFLCVGTLIFSTLVYFAEREAQPSFSSIPKCFWWSVITMTTVGYGDMAPSTRWGYLIGTVTAISGLLMVGFTVPVLVNNFILYYNHSESHIQREQQREKSLKRSNMHLLSHAVTELQKGGLSERRVRSPEPGKFNSFMFPISEQEDREDSDGGTDFNDNNNRGDNDNSTNVDEGGNCSSLMARRRRGGVGGGGVGGGGGGDGGGGMGVVIVDEEKEEKEASSNHKHENGGTVILDSVVNHTDVTVM